MWGWRMRCPKCECQEDKVIDSRSSKGGAAIRRRRECLKCGARYTTYEEVEKPKKLSVISENGEGVEDFSKERFGLAPIKVAEWEGLVFVNLDPNAEPLLTALRELPEQANKFSFHKMRLYERRIYQMECNWKTYIDNYLEGYHLPSVHPSLNRELDYNSYTTTLFERHSLQASPIRGPENESTTQRRYSQAKGDDVAEYYWIFPNWMLNCYPDNISLNIVLPVSPERSIAIFEWYFLEEALKTEAPAKTVTFSDENQVEDVRICEVVQKNLQSKSYDRGRYSVKQERGLHHFHSLYVDAMSS